MTLSLDNSAPFPPPVGGSKTLGIFAQASGVVQAVPDRLVTHALVPADAAGDPMQADVRGSSCAARSSTGRQRILRPQFRQKEL
jgi:hypothetical protein